MLIVKIIINFLMVLIRVLVYIILLPFYYLYIKLRQALFFGGLRRGMRAAGLAKEEIQQFMRLKREFRVHRILQMGNE